MSEESLLQLKDLQVNIGKTPVVRGVSFELRAGESLGIVGESGCGKSITALSIMRLLPQPPMHIESGDILFEGQNLNQLPERQLERIRGREIAMIFQEPMSSLNPVFSVGDQVSEVLYLHEGLRNGSARQRRNELFDKVGLSANRIADRFPHQLSGGQRQRVMIAMSLACNPKILIADEPTTALDVTVQAQILELLDQLRADMGMAILLIAHDLGVVRYHCDQVAVMYAGKIVESGLTRQLFNHPSHPYTRALLETIPAANARGKPLPSIEGSVPSSAHLPQGCSFEPRCRFSQEQCIRQSPELLHQSLGDHLVSCWYPVHTP